MKIIERVFGLLIVSIFVAGSVFADSTICNANFSQIKLGKTNNDILVFQNFLLSEGIMSGKATKYFGNVTKANVIKFQKKNSLKQTGLVDQATIENIKNKNCVSNNATTTTIVSTSTVPDIGPFKLEISADKYKINPDDQVLFTVKLTNITNATITDYKLGKVDCASDNLKIEPRILFDNSDNFWPSASFTTLNPCAGKRQNNYVADVPPGKSFEVKIPYKNFSKSTTAELMNYGNVTDGEHQAIATLEIQDANNKSIFLKSNPFKFYTVVDNSPEFPIVSVTIKADKTKIKKGEYIRFDAIVKNIDKKDFLITYGQPGNISESKQFLIDGIYGGYDFFVVNNKIVQLSLEDETLFKNYTGTFKIGEQKYYSMSAGFPDKLPTDDLLLMKRIKGQHYVQLVVVYQDNFGKTKRYESNKVPFEVILE